MWQKIATKAEALSLRSGSIVVKYAGEASTTPDTVDILDQNNFRRYEIHSIQLNTIHLMIPTDEIPETLFVNGTRVTGTVDNPPFLNKTFDELVNEKRWWKQNK